MGVGLRELTIGFLGAALATVATPATAQLIVEEAPPLNVPSTDQVGSRQVRVETVPDAFDRVLTNQSRTWFGDRSIMGQLDAIFGFGSIINGTYPENEIADDARNLEILYRDVLRQQVSTTPLIRTPDLNSPYNSSVLTSPAATSRVLGSELVYERVPPR